MTVRVGYILKMFPRLSETFILGEILELERQGVEVEIVSLMHPADGRFHGQLADLKATVHYEPREKADVYWERLWSEGGVDGGKLERAARFLRQYGIPKDLDLALRAALIAQRFQRLGVQHIHSHFATISTRVAAIVSEWTGIPFSFTSHAKDIFRETVDRSLYAELGNRSRFNITVSDYNRDYILEHTPLLQPEKVVRLYNGIDLEAFHPAARSADRDVLHVVSIGRLVPKKGFDVLLRSLDQWRDQGGRFQCTIVGDGDDETALHQLCSELRLDGVVTFAGAQTQEQVRQLLGEADMIALACKRDALGNQDALPTVLLEALAMDLPVASTTIAGVPEIVGDEAGVLAQPDDLDDFTRALQELAGRIEQGWPVSVCRQRAERLFARPNNAGELRRRFEVSSQDAEGAAS